MKYPCKVFHFRIIKEEGDHPYHLEKRVWRFFWQRGLDRSFKTVDDACKGARELIGPESMLAIRWTFDVDLQEPEPAAQEPAYDAHAAWARRYEDRGL